jgi:D-aminoacyl-tRNA deacylase
VRALVQRVDRAEVRVADEVVGAIGPGLCVLVGVTHDDDEARCDRLADKVAKLRIFGDEAGRMNRSVADVGGSVLVVSQFTLYGDARKGNRPSFVAAAGPERAEPLIARLVDRLRQGGLVVATGRFRAEMAVELVNDGPVTLLVES